MTIAIAALFLFASAGFAAEIHAVPPLVVELRANGDHLRRLALSASSSDSAFIHRPVPDDLPVEERAKAVAVVAYIGLSAWGQWSSTGFIEDPIATRVVAAGLIDESAEVRDEACALLLSYAKDEYLARVAEAIRASAARLERECGGRLLGRLDLTLAEAGALLGRRPDQVVRARLGDTRMEQGAIAAFESADEYDSKRRMAEILGYIGTPAAGAALARALYSPIALGSGPGDRSSIRVPIIFSLGKIHQDELLLGSELLWYTSRGDELMGGEAAVSEYLGRVYAWALLTYGVTPEGPDPGAYLIQTSATPVLH